MDRASQHLFQTHRTSLLNLATRLYGCDEKSVAELGGFESYLFEVRRDGRPFILRLTHSIHRSTEQVRGELDWVNYLAGRGVPVAAPVPSQGDRLAEKLDCDDSFFTAALFHKAPGRRPRADDFSSSFFAAWGEMIGRMHAATTSYLPAEPALARFHWCDDPTASSRQYDGVVESDILTRLEEIRETISAFRPEPSCYGLIHNDLHPGNFFIDGRRMTAFDFDDCHYAYFVNDIAIALFYSLRMPGQPVGNAAFAHAFLKHFLVGYRKHCTIDTCWLEHIPDFLKLREIDLYCVLLAHIGAEATGWAGEFLLGRRERILGGTPLIDLNISLL